MLTRRLLKQILHYEPLTGRWTWLVNRKGRFARVGKKAGSIDAEGYRIICIDGLKYRSGRLAWFYMKGVMPENEIDHKDTNPSNDKWKNLRKATRSQNGVNRGLQSNNTSGFKGVYFDKRRSQCKACIKINGKQVYLGSRDTPKEAYTLYVAAAKKNFGAFTRI